MKLRSTLSFGLHQLLRYVLACFFSLLLIFSLSLFITNFLTQVILFICTTCITFILLYQFAWDQGNHDANYVARGMASYCEDRGFTAGLFTLILPLIVVVIAFLSTLGVLPASLFQIHNFANPPFYAWIGMLFASVKEYVMEDGTVTGHAWMMCNAEEANRWFFLLEMIPILLMPVISWIGYKLGRKRIVLSEKLLFKSAKKKTK